MDDSISRQAAIKAICEKSCLSLKPCGVECPEVIALKGLPSVQEPLTDKEQRIFLSAMVREEKVCKEVDAEMVREPYEESEDSLVKVCREIKRKVKGALWTN